MVSTISPIRISEKVNSFENNCEKLIFIYSEIERIKKLDLEETYRNLKRKNILGASQYLLGVAERAVPMLLNLSIELRKMFVEKAKNWSSSAIEKAVLLPAKKLKLILDLPLKPTASYLSEILQEVIEENIKYRKNITITENYWAEIKEKFQLEADLLNYLKSSYLDSAELFENLAGFNFELKKLSFYHLIIDSELIPDSSTEHGENEQSLSVVGAQQNNNLRMAIRSDRESGINSVSEAKASEIKPQSENVKLDMSIPPRNYFNKDRQNDLSYVGLCCEEALASTKESGLKTFEDFVAGIVKASKKHSSSPGREQKGLLEAEVCKNGLKVWFKDPELKRLGYLTGGMVVEKLNLEDKGRYSRSGVESFLNDTVVKVAEEKDKSNSNNKAVASSEKSQNSEKGNNPEKSKNPEKGTNPEKSKTNVLNTNMVQKAISFEKKSKVKHRNAKSKLIRETDDLGESLTKSPGELNGLNSIGLTLQAGSTIGAIAYWISKNKDKKELVKLADRFNKLKDRSSECDREQQYYGVSNRIKELDERAEDLKSSLVAETGNEMEATTDDNVDENSSNDNSQVDNNSNLEVDSEKDNKSDNKHQANSTSNIPSSTNNPQAPSTNNIPSSTNNPQADSEKDPPNTNKSQVNRHTPPHLQVTQPPRTNKDEKSKKKENIERAQNNVEQPPDLEKKDVALPDNSPKKNQEQPPELPPNQDKSKVESDKNLSVDDRASRKDRQNKDPVPTPEGVLTTGEILKLLTKEIDALNTKVGQMVGEEEIQSLDNLDEAVDFDQKIKYLNKILDRIEEKLDVLESELGEIKKSNSRIDKDKGRLKEVEKIVEQVAPAAEMNLERTEKKSENIEKKLDKKEKESEKNTQEFISEEKSETKELHEENKALTQDFVTQMHKGFFKLYGKELEELHTHESKTILSNQKGSVAVKGELDENYNLILTCWKGEEKNFEAKLEMDGQKHNVKILQDNVSSHVKQEIAGGLKQKFKTIDKEKENSKEKEKQKTEDRELEMA